MIIASYFRSEDKNKLSQLDDTYPIIFQKEYASFLKKYLNNDLIFIISDCKEIFIPIRLYKIKLFSFAQILHPPIKDTKRLEKEEERTFLNELARFIKENKLCHRVVQPPNYSIFQAVPDGAAYCDFGTYFLNLQDYSEEELFTRFKNRDGTRTGIRHAEKEGVVIRYNQEQLPVLYELYKQTMKRSNMPVEPFSYLESLYAHLTDAKAVCAVVYHENSALGSLFVVYTTYSAYAFYSGSAEHITVSGAMDYLYWQIIKLMKSKGVKRFDFVGARLRDVSNTKFGGIQHFKEKFGPELERGYLWKMDIDKTYAKFFDTLLRFKLILKGKRAPQGLIEQELAAAKKTK